MIDIIKHNWHFRFTPKTRNYTKYIILHHAAAKTASPEDVHAWHLQRDGGTWAGIGYNFYVRKNGEIHEGRGLNQSGAHTTGYNSVSVGICFEGDFSTETVMNIAQLEAGKALLRYLHEIYPDAKIICHRDVNNTACPGTYFPLGELLRYNEVEKECDEMKRYKNVSGLPYGKEEIQALIDKGILKGKKNLVTGEDLGLDLSEDMLRILIIMYRCMFGGANA